MSVMFQPLEFVRWGIGNKKGPKTRAWFDRCTLFSGRASGQPNPSAGGWAAHSYFEAGICDDVHHGLVTFCIRPIPRSSGPHEILQLRRITVGRCNAAAYLSATSQTL